MSDRQNIAMSVSLIVAVLMLAGKMAAFSLTGSDAIFSDALESVVHVFATAFVAFSLWYSRRPADRSHPYGHGKIAYFSAGFEGGLIFLAAVSIVYQAVLSLIRGPELQQLGLGIVITAGILLINLALGLWLVRVGRNTGSLVLVSNGKHVLTDMWTSLGVLLGIGLVFVSGIQWIDPAVAIAAAMNIAWTAVVLGRRAVRGLMERTDEADTQRIKQALRQAVASTDIEDFHQVRHRRVEADLWIEYHLLFDEDLGLVEAHERSHRVEELVRAAFPGENITVTAHLEPSHHDMAHPDGFVEPSDPLA